MFIFSLRCWWHALELANVDIVFVSNINEFRMFCYRVDSLKKKIVFGHRNHMHFWLLEVDFVWQNGTKLYIH